MPKLLTEEVVTYLHSTGMVGTPGLSLFADLLPDTPTTCTAIVATGGYTETLGPMNIPTFQVLHRNTNANSGKAMINTLSNLLGDKWNALPTAKGLIDLQSYPGMHYRDTNTFIVWTLNCAYRSSLL